MTVIMYRLDHNNVCFTNFINQTFPEKSDYYEMKLKKNKKLHNVFDFVSSQHLPWWLTKCGEKKTSTNIYFVSIHNSLYTQCIGAPIKKTFFFQTFFFDIF